MKLQGLKTQQGKDSAHPPLQPLTRSLEDDEKVQTEDADGRVILDAQVNVLLDTKAKVAVLGEIVTTQLVLTHLCGR